MKQAIYKIRTDSNMQKRYDGFHFLSSRTVLSKGLEFECITIDMSDPLKMKNNGYHSISFLLISSGIFGGSLENPVAESIDVKLCAFTASEMKEAEHEYEAFKQN